MPCFLIFLYFFIPQGQPLAQRVTPSSATLARQQILDQWKDKVVYEVFIQSFADSNQDGIGDIPGMITKLDYLKNLGISAIWLMPIHPSPSYHKYDVTNYFDVHPDYGTLEGFKKLLREAHQRDILVLIDLVINHCSREHPWFLEAKKDKNSPYRDYFIWADSLEIEHVNQEEKIKDDTYHPNQWRMAEGNQEKYYGFFSDHMPDLNYDNPMLREEVIKIAKFWLEMGVDGFRLDGARHIYLDNRAADSHDWWHEFERELIKINSKPYLVGEVWADATFAAPFLSGLHSVFHFDLGKNILSAIQHQQPQFLIENLENTYKKYQTINQFIDATFLTNHDQNRILSQLNGDLNQSKLAASMLFTLPGVPFIYYGEEIGMLGKKPDEYIREPILWTEQNQDSSQTKWINPQYSTSGKVKSLEVQAKDSSSIFTHYKKLISTRNQNPVLSAGEIKAFSTTNSKICSFIRYEKGEFWTLFSFKKKKNKHWVFHNFSDSAQIFERPKRSRKYKKVKFKSSPEIKLSKETISLSPFGSIIISK